MTTHFVVTGVCGCGKTTAAPSLQKHLGQCPYAEGDEFHTQPTATRWARVFR